MSWAQRFPALQSGDLDVIIKVTGWTMSRDTELGLQFSRLLFAAEPHRGAYCDSGDQRKEEECECGSNDTKSNK